jgi:hypothetical protein
MHTRFLGFDEHANMGVRIRVGALCACARTCIKTLGLLCMGAHVREAGALCDHAVPAVASLSIFNCNAYSMATHRCILEQLYLHYFVALRII